MWCPVVEGGDYMAQRKRREKVLSAHLHGLLAVTPVYKDFYSNIASVKRGQLKFMDVTINFRLFY